MQEPYNEGLADHVGPESCGYAGNGISEALIGVHAGRVLSRVSYCVTDRSTDAVETYLTLYDNSIQYTIF